jgi:hypothetical protein
MKPEACKLWPFKVLSEPKYGEPNQAAFDYMGNKLYVYADTMCSGLRYGTQHGISAIRPFENSLNWHSG